MVRIVKAVPTNIITGFLGAGKTTAINHLLAQKPAQERWAVLVNEFGQIGVDQSLLAASQGVSISEIPGGCLCCTRGPQMRVALARLLREANPDRLLIEPTGLGHPSGIIDLLQGPDFGPAIDLRSMICLIDPQVLDEPRVMQHPVFNDQIELADILVLNKTDQCSAEQLSEAQTLSNNMFPAKQAVLKTTRGVIPVHLLDQIRPCAAKSSPLAPASPALEESSESAQGTASPGVPLFQSGHLDGMHSYSWLFHVNDQFETDKVLTLLDADTQSLRIKAVLRIGHAWISYNRTLTGEREVRESSWRRDSRIEIISDEQMDRQYFSERLTACLKQAS